MRVLHQRHINTEPEKPDSNAFTRTRAYSTPSMTMSPTLSARISIMPSGDPLAAHSDTSDQVFRRHMISHSGVSDHPEMTPSGAVW